MVPKERCPKFDWNLRLLHSPSKRNPGLYKFDSILENDCW